MDKKFCDQCGKDITRDEHFEASVYDNDKEENILENDLCKKCAKEFLKYFKEKVK